MQEAWGYNHTHHHLFLAQPPPMGEEGRGGQGQDDFFLGSQGYSVTTQQPVIHIFLGN